MFKFELGQIVKVGKNKVKGVIVGRELHEDAEGTEIAYRVFNKRGECSQSYLEDEIHVSEESVEGTEKTVETV